MQSLRKVPPESEALDAPARWTASPGDAGQIQGFSDRIDLHLDHSYRLARAILGNDADAADAVQDAWLSVWRGLAQLRDDSRFVPWLDRIVVNACRAIARRRGPVRELTILPDFDPPSRLPGPDAVADREVVERAFAQLSVDHRTVLVLHHLEQMSVIEIAAALGIAEGTVKSRLHAARGQLQRAVELEQ